MAEFIAMGGYAQFVWSAFGFWFACVIFNIVSARRRIRISLEQAAAAAERQRYRRNIRQARDAKAKEAQAGKVRPVT